MNRHVAFLWIIGAIFLALTVIFTALPRSVYSELEKRDLAVMPQYSHNSLLSGAFTRDVSHWFNDTEPMRDRFMAMSMQLKSLSGIKLGGGDAVTFIAESTPSAPSASQIDEENGSMPAEADLGINAPAKIAAAGIIIAGDVPTVRAMMVYKGLPAGGREWAATTRFYAETLGKGVRIYAVVIPTPIEFYCPEKVRERTYSQKATIDNIYKAAGPTVTPVDVHSALARHAAEPIYFRTDHHWTPLGAYYASEQIAKAAGLPFSKIDRFDRHTRQGFVGSMFGYSKDIAVKESPEEFVWYTPKDSAYTTNYKSFRLDSAAHVIGRSGWVPGKFFMPGSFKGGGSYSMFMGGDAKLTRVVTGVKNGRRLLIIKDSFGNAIPPFLFGTFEEVHVVDHRYFVDNLKKYIQSSGITDVAIVSNIFSAYSPAIAKAIQNLLTQPDDNFYRSAPHQQTNKPRKEIPKEETPAAEPPALPDEKSATTSRTDSIK